MQIIDVPVCRLFVSFVCFVVNSKSIQGKACEVLFEFLLVEIGLFFF